jgi:hypothetical protein
MSRAHLQVRLPGHTPINVDVDVVVVVDENMRRT